MATAAVPAEAHEAWSRYWQTGALHSCSPGDGAALFSEGFWKGFFAGLEGSVRVLDIGTGNGLLPILATRELGSRAKVYGIDAAQIHPEATRHPELVNVTFMPGVRSERMPFDSASIDVATSQFALEYSNVSASLDEVLRVLAPDGRLALVMHAHDSRITHVSQSQLVQIEWLQRPGGFLDLAREMIGVLQARRVPGTDDGSHAVVRERYNEAAKVLVAKLEQGDTGEVLARAAVGVQRALAAAASGRRVEEIAGLEELANAFGDEASRLREQLDAARTPEQMRAIGSHLEAAGMEVAIGALHQQGQRMAWTVVAKR